MKKLIFLTIGLGIVLGIIIGANVVNRCASAQSNFPMCVTVYKYLVWPREDFQSNAIPIASTTQGYLMNSNFKVVGGALQFPPSNPPSQPKEGMIYYDEKDQTFYCFVKGTWQSCGGVSPTIPISNIIPFKIYEDSTLKKVILEINEE
jgi:hypothetical protein